MPNRAPPAAPPLTSPSRAVRTGFMGVHGSTTRLRNSMPGMVESDQHTAKEHLQRNWRCNWWTYREEQAVFLFRLQPRNGEQSNQRHSFHSYPGHAERRLFVDRYDDLRSGERHGYRYG